MPDSRETRTSSDDPSYYSAEGDLIRSIESFVVHKDPYRVTGRGSPRPFPMKTTVCTTEMAEITDTHVASRAADILSHFNIVASRGLYQRSRLGHSVHTYLISTNSQQTNHWRTAAEQILQLLLAAGVDNDDIEVEVCNPELMILRTSHVLPDDEKLLGALNNIRPKVLKYLQENLPSFWTSVAYHLRGSKYDQAPPKIPTILVFCYHLAIAAFDKFQNDLEQLLSSEEITVALEILPGEIDPQHGKYKLLGGFNFDPTNGASISFAGSNNAGTLGGWINAKTATRSRVKCALTCYHVVTQPSPDQVDVKPFEPRSQGCRIEVEYPATIDRQGSVSFFQSSVKKGTNPGAMAMQQRALDRLSALASFPSIGSVVYVSGVWKNVKNRKMDWALIETPTTFKNNVPPPATSFSSSTAHLYPDNEPVYYTADTNTRVQRVGRLGMGDWVCKRGRTTEDTSGQINRMARDVRWPGSSLCTQEIEAMGLLIDFADGGDSGSFVYNKVCELVGMVIGTDRNHGLPGCGLVTPMDDIMDDFKDGFDGGSLWLG